MKTKYKAIKPLHVWTAMLILNTFMNHEIKTNNDLH